MTPAPITKGRAFCSGISLLRPISGKIAAEIHASNVERITSCRTGPATSSFNGIKDSSKLVIKDTKFSETVVMADTDTLDKLHTSLRRSCRRSSSWHDLKMFRHALDTSVVKLLSSSFPYLLRAPASSFYGKIHRLFN